LEDEIRLRFGLPIRPVIATPSSITQGIAKYYAPGLRKEASESTASAGLKSSSTSSGGKTTRTLTDEEKYERRNLGLILLCWAFAIPAVLDNMWLWDKVYKFYLPKVFVYFPFISTTLIGLPLCYIIFLTMVKPNQK